MMTTMQSRIQRRRELVGGKNFLFAGLGESTLHSFEYPIKLHALNRQEAVP